MTDFAKRNTLKILAVTASAAATSSAVYATGLLGKSAENSPSSSEYNDPVLAQIEVTSRLSAHTNELEIVLTNTGDHTTTITQMTPQQIRVKRGEFDLGTILENGPLKLDAGKSASVPMAHRPVMIDTAKNQIDASLHDVIKNNMSIVTDYNAFASVSVFA